MTPVELSRTVLRAVRRAVDDGELRVDVPGRAVVTAPGPGGCGDYATNIALQLARPAGQPPKRVAEVLRPYLLGAVGVSEVVVTGPGFLNISLRRGEASAGLVREILRSGARYGYADRPTGEVVRLHAPHEVRAVVFMDAVARVLRSQGVLVRTGCAARPEPEWSEVLGAEVDVYGMPESSAPVEVDVRPVPAGRRTRPLSVATPVVGPCSIPRLMTGPVSPASTSPSVRAIRSSGSVTPMPVPGRSAATPPIWDSTPTPEIPDSPQIPDSPEVSAKPHTVMNAETPGIPGNHGTPELRRTCVCSGSLSPTIPASWPRPRRIALPIGSPGIFSSSPMPWPLFFPLSFPVVRRNPRPPTVPGSRLPKLPGWCWPAACPCSASTHPTISERARPR